MVVLVVSRIIAHGRHNQKHVPSPQLPLGAVCGPPPTPIYSNWETGQFDYTHHMCRQTTKSWSYYQGHSGEIKSRSQPHTSSIGLAVWTCVRKTLSWTCSAWLVLLTGSQWWGDDVCYLSSMTSSSSWPLVCGSVLSFRNMFVPAGCLGLGLGFMLGFLRLYVSATHIVRTAELGQTWPLLTTVHSSYHNHL